MEKLDRSVRLLRQAGPVGLARAVLNYAYRRSLRRIMPIENQVIYSGVPISVERRIFDRVVGKYFGSLHTEDIADYEITLLNGLQRAVKSGDKVVIVGGGVGVTAVVAAQLAAPDGHVTCFEGSERQVELVRETVRRNAVSDRVTVRHALVGQNIGVRGTLGAAEVVSAGSRPPCDVLELDCEGSEVEILRDMGIRPRSIIVESHGFRGAPSAGIQAILQGLGYAVEVGDIAEPRARAFCEDNDVRILFASKA